MIPIYKHLFDELDPTRILACCYLWSIGVCLDGISKYLLFFHIKQVCSTFSTRSQKTSIAVTSVISFFLLLALASTISSWVSLVKQFKFSASDKNSDKALARVRTLFNKQVMSLKKPINKVLPTLWLSPVQLSFSVHGAVGFLQSMNCFETHDRKF